MGRELIPNSCHFSMDDLHAVAQQHAVAIQAARAQLSPLVVVDTDVYITQSYAHFTFGKWLELPPSVYQANKADLRLYLNTNIAFVQDGSRLPEQKRDLLDASHRAALQAFHQPYHDLTSSVWASRCRDAADLVSRLFVLPSLCEQ